MQHALLWFREDQRLADNPALQDVLRMGLIQVRGREQALAALAAIRKA